MRFALFLLISPLLLWASPVEATITFGVVPHARSLFSSMPQAQRFATYLEKRLGEDVGVREFQSAEQLHDWLIRFRMVDLAALPVEYIRQQPPGTFDILATVVPEGIDAPSASELVVARQGGQRGLRNRIEVVLAAMAGDPEGSLLLAEVGVARLLGAKISQPVDLTARPAPVPSAIPASRAQKSSAGPVVSKVSPMSRSAAMVLSPSPNPLMPDPHVAGGLPAEPTGGGIADLGSSAPVHLAADELVYEKEASLYRATGGVQLQKGAVALSADRMLFNEAAATVQASGRVHLTDPTGELRAEELDYGLDSGLGRITTGNLFVKEHNFHLVGAEIEKIGVQNYRVEQGTFTTCDGDVPSWKFGANHIDVELGKYAQARHVLFYLHDVPVLYFPYLAFPVKTERESGLLMPRFGYSNKRGVELSLAYYQVIARNQDATLYVDYLSDFGSGQGLEYRYLFGEDNEGFLKGYYVNNVRDRYLRDKIKEDPTLAGTLDESDRYALEWQHSGTLPASWRLNADVEYVSNRDYFDEFGEAAADYNKDQTESRVFLSRAWQNSILAGGVDYTQDLELDDSSTLQRLPDIRFDMLRQRIGDTPFYYSLGSAYTYFWREEEVDTQIKGQRLRVRPAVSAVFTPLAWLEVMPEVGYHERIYQTSAAGPGYEHEGLYDFSTRVSTSFYRVYAPSAGPYRKIRHSIEPEMTYTHIPNVNQDHLPRFDALDRIVPENQVEYALVNRIVARLDTELGTPEYLELIYLRLGQSFDIRQSRHDRDDLSGEEPFSEILAELILSPTPSTVIDLDARYDPHSRTLQTFNAQSGLHDRDGNGLAFDYRYARDLSEYVGAQATLAWLAPVYLGYEQRYDFSAQVTLEQLLSMEYRAQCWSVFLSLRDRLDEQEYMLTFALAGIGNVFNLGGGLGSQGKAP